LDGCPFVVPETGCCSSFIKTFGLETGLEKNVSVDACLGQAIATLVDFKENPSITVQTCELVFVDELLWNVRDFDETYYGLGMGMLR
jgi:hypothetical protein